MAVNVSYEKDCNRISFQGMLEKISYKSKMNYYFLKEFYAKELNTFFRIVLNIYKNVCMIEVEVTAYIALSKGGVKQPEHLRAQEN